MYTSSRALYALALSGSAPAIFKRTTSWGLPWHSLIFTFMVDLLAYMSVGAGTAGQVFSWLANLLSVCGLISWTGTFFTYLRFDAGVKAQNRTIGAIYGLVLCCLFLFTNSFTVFMKGQWDMATFITSFFLILNAEIKISHAPNLSCILNWILARHINPQVSQYPPRFITMDLLSNLHPSISALLSSILDLFGTTSAYSHLNGMTIHKCAAIFGSYIFG
ncbi:hypothetical protein O181_028875 [Austropuccinia psidii MF-1]|uniref:Amino acid permease/ SLC12A domain-containing protein n=1 Tax=Austropuccinia psidii MF-1 TaxID=1389203 RepID=A0A9Q3H4N3_9BASI|nr:hypothetical protein [Austropuccinia psidii MF-1]